MVSLWLYQLAVSAVTRAETISKGSHGVGWGTVIEVVLCVFGHATVIWREYKTVRVGS